VCASVLGYAFVAPPLLNLETEITGLRYEDPIQRVTDFELPYAHTGVPAGVVLGNSSPRKIIMWGFFQQADKYSQHRALIKEWFKSSLVPIIHGPGTMGVSIRRRDDYCALGWNLPLSYYEIAMHKAAETVSPSTCLVYSDVPANELESYVDIFSKYCKVEVLSHLDKMDQLQSMMGCSNLIGCNSTFSWWATFLSNAEHVWMPHDWQPWGKGQTGDKTWPIGHQYPFDLRHYEKGWHILYGKDFNELG
jgi:hypothetical protein